MQSSTRDGMESDHRMDILERMDCCDGLRSYHNFVGWEGSHSALETNETNKERETKSCVLL